MTPASKPEKSEWMQIAESDNASSNVRKVDKRLTLGTLAAVGAIVIAGSLFANASDEPSAVADINSVATTSSSTASAPTPQSEPSKASSTTPVATPQASKIQAPSIAQMPKGGGDDDDDEHEGREGRGDHRERGEDHDDEDFGDDD
ncbi:hypothetical protein MCEMRE26_01318 [Candidatus Nanopelagicaceae bacterium]